VSRRLTTVVVTVIESASVLAGFLLAVAATSAVLGSRWDSEECAGLCFGDAVLVFLVSLLPGVLCAVLALALVRRFVTRPLAARLAKPF
jgi:hypothetical protein